MPVLAGMAYIELVAVEETQKEDQIVWLVFARGHTI